MHLFLFTNSALNNWFQYVRRVFATANNFPCVITLIVTSSRNKTDLSLLKVKMYFQEIPGRTKYIFRNVKHKIKELKKG